MGHTMDHISVPDGRGLCTCVCGVGREGTRIRQTAVLLAAY